MKENKRGISCSIYGGLIREFLLFLAKEKYSFFIPYGSVIHHKNMLLPAPIHSINATFEDVQKLADTTIWELVLHVYPQKASKAQIETYEDFLNSDCICCLIYYDCGIMDVYIKENILFDVVLEKLTALSAKNIEIITDINDGREVLSV